MSDMEAQIEKIIAAFRHIDAPPIDGFPAIRLEMVGPLYSIAHHLYMKGVRVVDEVAEPVVEVPGLTISDLLGDGDGNEDR